MSSSLLDLTRPLLTSDVIDRLATFTGESPDATAKAFAAAAPAVIAGMLQVAQDPNGLTQLVNLFQQGKFDGGMLDNLAGAYSGSSMDGLMRTGGPLLGSIFGARSAALVDLIAGYAGVKRASAMSLISAAAPFVMSLMGRQLLARGGINAANVKELLASQREGLAQAVPPGLGGVLGGQYTAMGGTAAQAARLEAIGGASPMRRLLPLLLVLVLVVVLAVIAMRSCGRSPATTTPPRDTTQTMRPDAGAAPREFAVVTPG